MQKTGGEGKREMTRKWGKRRLAINASPFGVLRQPTSVSMGTAWPHSDARRVDVKSKGEQGKESDRPAGGKKEES